MNKNIVETDVHILLECHIAKSVWFVINDRLKSAYLDVITINKHIIFYKIGVGKPQSHLISLVNWNLWKNRNSIVYDNTSTSHVSVLKKLFYDLKLTSDIDRVILSIKIYNKRWLGLNQAIEALDIWIYIFFSYF